jgi:enoyl-CoA hydratase/carnithine racemase
VGRGEGQVKAVARIEFERHGKVGHIRLNRPEVLNACTDDMVRELREVLYEFDDDPEIEVGILSGAGRAFSSGADVRQRHLRPLDELRRLGSAQARDTHIVDLSHIFVKWKPLIAAVHGFAVGAGLQFCLMCDIIVAAEGTKFQITEVTRGVDGTRFWHVLADRASGGFATEVGLTGRFWTAEEGKEAGAVDHLAPVGSHIEVAEGVAASILANPPLAVRAIVEARRRRLAAIELRHKLTAPRSLHTSEDFREAASAFIEKRAPVFHGR